MKDLIYQNGSYRIITEEDLEGYSATTRPRSGPPERARVNFRTRVFLERDPDTPIDAECYRTEEDAHKGHMRHIDRYWFCRDGVYLPIHKEETDEEA